MVTLTRANRELFRRTPDECFDSFEALHRKACYDRENSVDRWIRPQEMLVTQQLGFCCDGQEFSLNDWSFSQVCKMSRVHRDTINRLSSQTASKAFEETLPRKEKPIQLLTRGELIRSVHGVTYTRLWNADLLDVVSEFASEFSPPQKALDATSTGLYCGEQDLFAFLIDPAGWAEIDGEAFAPGFFIWNSEVGRRSLGIQTFWFQKICQNHIVWDAVEVTEFTRKHTANVRDGLHEIRRIIEGLQDKRNSRRDGFVKVMKKAMTEKLGADADAVAKILDSEGIPRRLLKEALEIAQAKGAFTIFSVVDALTKLSQRIQVAGDRTAMDVKIGKLLNLATAA